MLARFKLRMMAFLGRIIFRYAAAKNAALFITLVHQQERLAAAAFITDPKDMRSIHVLAPDVYHAIMAICATVSPETHEVMLARDHGEVWNITSWE